MDPIANLKEQLDIAKNIQQLWDEQCDNHGKLFGKEPHRQAAEYAERLAELVIALDECRRKGGFDPYTPVYTLATPNPWGEAE